MVVDSESLQFLEVHVSWLERELELLAGKRKVDQSDIGNDVHLEDMIFVNNVADWNLKMAQVIGAQLDGKLSFTKGFKLFELGLSFGQALVVIIVKLNQNDLVVLVADHQLLLDERANKNAPEVYFLALHLHFR